MQVIFVTIFVFIDSRSFDKRYFFIRSTLVIMNEFSVEIHCDSFTKIVWLKNEKIWAKVRAKIWAKEENGRFRQIWWNSWNRFFEKGRSRGYRCWLCWWLDWGWFDCYRDKRVFHERNSVRKELKGRSSETEEDRKLNTISVLKWNGFSTEVERFQY